MEMVYEMAKQCKRNKRDIVEIPCIRGKSSNLKIALKDKIHVWKEYLEELLNKKI